MRRLTQSKSVNIFLTAILILNQAVFLFIPVLAGQAQTTTPYINTNTTTYTTPSTNTTTYVPPTTNTTTYITPSTNTTYVAPQTNTTTYTAPTTNTTYTTPQTNTTTNAVPSASDLNIIFEDIITDTTDTSTHYILTLEFLSPPTKLSGQPNFSVKTSEEAEVVFYIYKDGVEINKFNAISKGDNTYSFTWDTTSTSNGQYTIKASAKKSGYVDMSRQISVTVDNSTPVINNSPTDIKTYAEIPKQINTSIDNPPPTIDNNLTNTKTTDLTVSYEITFMEAYQPPFSGEKRITASLNKDMDGVDFSINGPRNDKYSGIRDNNRQYYFMWNTTSFPNGYYKVTANARVAGTIKASRSFSVQVANNGTSPNNQLQPMQTLTPEMMEKQPLQMMPQVQPELLPECKKNNITSIEECQRFMNIPPDCRERGLLSQEECQKFKSIPPDCRDKGLLSMEECKKYMSIPPQCREKGILDQEECKKYSYRFSMPTECQKAGVTTPEECNNIIFLNSMPTECQKAGVKSREDCGKIVKIQVSLSPECQKAKITDQAACDKYMAKNFMASECKQAGVTTMEECDYILRGKVSNLNVRVKIEVKTEQGTEIREVGLPEECRQAGAVSAEECEKILFKKNAPKECIDAGISTPDKCEKFMFEKSAPTDCQEAGISTMEACKKYMFEKYGGAEKIPADKLPIECQKAGAANSADCDKVMRKMYLPKECQDQGITDEGKCDLYMQQKNMPKECQQAGAKTRSDCDKIMFKKYGPKECLAAGIEDDVKCEEFMFSKYAPQVTCQGIDDWQCKNSIKERHLGNIVAKQVQYQELEEKVAFLAGGSVGQEELTASLDVAKEMMPLKEGKAGLKVLGMEGKLTLDDGDNLVQTSPMALMIDSDQDGLPDDMEKRMGTDPNKADSDGDGYDDGAEVKNNYNPSGEGNLGNVLSPVEKAIVANKKLGQPKSEGEVSEDLSVDSVNNISDEENTDKGYSLEGTAEAGSVVTLYLYSDLPLVATVKADEYGNWQYDFTQSLIEGEHEVYVALNDNTGKITAKSNPFSFFIQEAKAASVGDFISETVAPITPGSETGSLIKYYAIIAALIMVVGILLFVIFIVQKKKQL
ncbi:MAG: Ig-like domain-containing protein [Patescibacteria group bacterium]